ncbi:MAG: DUF4339 domain-containing protein [Lentisphaeria bacterium]
MLALMIGIICGIISAIVANSKGRSAVGWFFLGFFFGFIGLIIICCLSDLNAQRAKEQNAERERRRLREQLKQERMKNSTFRQHVHKRLDQHDNALGVNTKSTGAVTASVAAQPALLGNSPQKEVETQGVDTGRAGPEGWHVYVDQQQHGPLTQYQIESRIANGELAAGSLIWRPGMDRWYPITEIKQFQRML